MDTKKIKYFIPKLHNRVLAKKRDLLKYFNIEKLSMLGYMEFADAKAFKSRLRNMLGNYNSSLLNEISEDDRQNILSSAEQTLRHEFDLLGSGIIKSDPIDWHADLKCEKRWEKLYYRKISYIPGADIKMPWELSRCQHLLWLGEAYMITKDVKYAQEVIDEINWWIDDNPLMYTVNWKCAMDVAFRAVNWMFALNMIGNFGGFDNAFSDKVSQSLWQHGFFIYMNLEKGVPNSNNHYASDIVGLLYLGVLFEQTKKGKNWLSLALKEYVNETLCQVLPSGVHFERSVSYHRLMTELLSYPVYMLQRMGKKVSSEVEERIGEMYSFIANYTKPNGYSPLIADNDDGRFVPFLRRDFRYHNYLNDETSIENALVSAGLKPVFCSNEKATKLYGDAGFAVIRNGKDYVFVNNGGYSRSPEDSETLIVTHTHNDLLSFELVLNGEDIIIDPGTYLYTSSKKDRDAFRATSKHNTVFVDEEEQNGFAAPFALKRNVKVGELYKINNTEFRGSYNTIRGQMTHSRYFIFKNNELVIRDFIRKAGIKHEAKCYFHFADTIIPVIKDNQIELNNNISIFFNKHPDHLEIIDDTLSPSFGVLVAGKMAIATYSFENELNIETVFTN